MADKYSASSYFVNIMAAIYGVFTVQELAAMVGIGLGVATFGVNFWFKLRKERRDVDEHVLHQAIEKQRLKMTVTSKREPSK